MIVYEKYQEKLFMNKREARGDHSVRQEFIINGLLVTLDDRDKIYFKGIEDFQIFYGFWSQDKHLTIKECLQLTKKEMAKKISLLP